MCRAVGVSRRVQAIALTVALLATSIGSMLLPAGLSRFLHGSLVAGIALNLWAVLLAPSIFFMTVAFSPSFIQAHFRLTMAVGFVFNVLTWTGVLCGISYLLGRVRNRRKNVPADPA